MKYKRIRVQVFLFAVILLSVVITGQLQSQESSFECEPTQEDMMGPYYEANAPMRSKVGEGYVLRGMVKSAEDCDPIAAAQIEFWMAGPDGEYADAYRARLKTGKEGGYRFESHVPVSYGGRPPHIHIRVTAQGHKPLVTQHYPEQGSNSASMVLVLRHRR